MYEIVRRLRIAYPAPEYAVLVDIVDMTHTRIIDEGDKLP